MFGACVFQFQLRTWKSWVRLWRCAMCYWPYTARVYNRLFIQSIKAGSDNLATSGCWQYLEDILLPQSVLCSSATWRLYRAKLAARQWLALGFLISTWKTLLSSHDSMPYQSQLATAAFLMAISARLHQKVQAWPPNTPLILKNYHVSQGTAAHKSTDKQGRFPAKERGNYILVGTCL